MATAESKPGSVSLYITKTRINAKRIIWKTLKALNRARDMGGSPKEAELCLELPNGSSIYLLGANNRDEIEKFRGLPIAIVILDEAQILTDLEVLVDEVLVPALMDFDGSVVLAGTPAPVPVGYFYEATTNPEWEHHAWTVFENPWIEKKSGKSPQAHLEAELKRRGVTLEEPSIQREWFGKWVYDPNALVFRYEALRNHYDELPSLPHGEWECVIGGDLGFDDSDALCVLTWNTTRPDLYLVYEDVTPKQGITALGNKLTALVEKWKPLATVLDFGGLGKKIAEELTQRWSLNVQPAEKERKLEHIELLNDAMRTGVFHAKSDSQFARDAMLVEWDKTNPELPKISDRFHSDICFVAGTLIQTEDGPRPIESIQAGERVWTRAGLRQALAAGPTGQHETWEVTMASGAVLRGTREHPVLTQRGWVGLGHLMPSDTVTEWKYPSPSSLKAAPTEGPSATPPEGSGCIESSGRSTTASSQRVGSFTTWTETLRTTLLRTWKRCRALLTRYSTMDWMWLASTLLTGTAPQRGGPGIVSMAGAPWQSGVYSSLSARCAAAPSRASFPTPADAVPPVPPWRGGRAVTTMSATSARSATAPSGAIATTSLNTAPVRVLLVRPTGLAEPVFNLSVEGAPEYFANGVLVHNCDAVLYGYRRARQWLFVPESPTPPKPGSLEWLEARAAEAQAQMDEAFESKLERNRERQMEREQVSDDMGWL